MAKPEPESEALLHETTYTHLVSALVSHQLTTALSPNLPHFLFMQIVASWPRTLNGFSQTAFPLDPCQEHLGSPLTLPTSCKLITLMRNKLLLKVIPAQLSCWFNQMDMSNAVSGITSISRNMPISACPSSPKLLIPMPVSFSCAGCNASTLGLSHVLSV